MELAAGLEAGRDAHILGEEADGLDGELGSFVSGLACRILTEELGDFAEAAAGSDAVVFLNVGEKDGVALAVRQVVEAAELMGHGVHVAEAGVVEGHAGEIFGVAHTFTGFLVGAVGDGAAEVAVDVFHGLFSAGIGHGGGGGGNISFHGVGQGVHAGGGGE